MAYALGYDRSDFASDDEDDLSGAGAGNQFYRQRQSSAAALPKPLEMDSLDTATLERLEWMEPLGYRALSEVTGLSTANLRKHFWCSKLKPRSQLFEDINYYFVNSHSQGHNVQMRIKKIIELKRFNENNCDYKDPNVNLLWHGTQTNNVAGILTNGFRLPVHNGMFGRGVYFADRVSKSAQYCRTGVTRGATGVLFLCAVNLGRVYESNTGMNHITSPPTGFDSVKGCGTNVPDPRDVRIHRGAKMPCGRTQVGYGGRGGLMHNEFIVYDLSKIAILFMVEFEYM